MRQCLEINTIVNRTEMIMTFFERMIVRNKFEKTLNFKSFYRETIHKIAG